MTDINPLRRYCTLLIAGGFIVNQSLAGEPDASRSQAIFTPLLPDVAQPALASGNQINSNNVAHYSRWLDGALDALIRNDKLTISLGPALDFPVHPNYLEATLKHQGEASIDPLTGDISSYHSGRPFSQPLEVDDPLSGLKAAWNMRYAYAPDEIETASFIWQYKDMEREKLERTLKMYGAILRYQHRHTHEPMPEIESNPTDLYTAMYLRVNYPQDIRNTQLLIHRKEQDSASEQAWLYTNTQRRVRRLATGQKTDAFLGSDIMIEDFLGYNGRIKDMSWVFLGSDYLLLPMYAHTQLPLADSPQDAEGYQPINFSGQGNCFPDVSWQLRKVLRLEALPKDKHHPLSKRHYIIDAATFTPVLGLIYDNAGKLWKLSIAAMSHSGFHAPQNATWQGVINDGVSMIDLQANHCTTLQIKSQLSAKPLSHRHFTVQHLRAMGR